MDLNKSGKLLFDLRKAKGMTQKQVADRLGIVAKTVSKWETGHGFPDVSLISKLADVFGVSERTLLYGSLNKNSNETGNMKNTRFYVCPQCGSIVYGVGKCQIICCGQMIAPLNCKKSDNNHLISISETENDLFIEFKHEMTKSHYISFVTYVGYDRTLMVRLYPEQDSSARFPKMYGGKIYYYCSKHGLYEWKYVHNL